MPEQGEYGGPSFGGPAPGAPGGPEHSGPGGPGGYGGFPTDGSAADLADLAGALADAIEAGQSGGTVGTAAQEDLDANEYGGVASSLGENILGSGMEGLGEEWGVDVDPSGYSYGGYSSGLVGGSPGLISKGRTDQEGTGYYDNLVGQSGRTDQEGTGYYDNLIGSSKQSGRVDQEGMGYYDNLVGSARPSGRVDQEGTGYDPLAGYPNTPPPGYGSAATPALTSVWGDNPNLDMGIPTAQPPGALLGENLGTIAYDEEAITEKDITEKGAKAAKEVVKDAKYHTQAYADLAKGYMETLDALRANPQGQTHGINNTTLANAYSTMDQTMKAFTVVHGPSKFGKFVGYLAKAVVPGLSALQAIENSLIAKGMYDNTTGQAMLAQVAAAIASGDHLQGGGGEDQEEDSISNFISQYPWAEGLDPNYIKYLIENPQELQKLLTGEAEI